MDYAGADFGPLQQAKTDRDAKFFNGCSRVLDLGCGPGHFLASMAAQGTAAYGVDVEEASLAVVRARNLNARFENVLDHLFSLDSGAVDGIHCSNLLEHLPVDQAKSLVFQSAKILAPRGRLLVSTSNAACLGVVAGAFWDDEQHVRPYTGKLLSGWAKAAGLQILTCGPDEYSRPQSPARRLLRLMRRLAVGPFFEAPELLLTAQSLSGA
jgi:O-antigen chain-terminating methyltransferase